MSQTDDDLLAVIPTTPTVEQTDESGVMQVPCTITLIDARKFHVPDVGAWHYHEHGVFATGFWLGEDEEVDVLIPHARIDHTQLHFDRLSEFYSDIAAAEEDLLAGRTQAAA